MSGKIFTDRLHKVLFGFKMGLSASVFHCKNNSKKYGDLSLQKVLKISPNLRLSILINLVLKQPCPADQLIRRVMPIQ